MEKDKNKQKKEGNKYDKVFKENAVALFLKLVEWQSNFKIKKYTPLETKLQTTLEREMDSLFEVETEIGDKFIFHIEFQSESEPKMLYRLAEYHGILLKRYGKPIRHLVIYFGRHKPNMPNHLPDNQQFKSFDLLSVRDLDRKKLLASQVPEVIMLAILSKYPKNQSEEVLRSTIEQLLKVTPNKIDMGRYLKQLTMIAKLRKLEESTLKIIQDMTVEFDVRTHYFFQLGAKEGRLEGKEEGRLEGKEEGRLEGKEEGRLEGKEEEREIAKQKKDQSILELVELKMLTLGQIAKVFDVSVVYIKDLINSNKAN